MDNRKNNVFIAKTVAISIFIVILFTTVFFWFMKKLKSTWPVDNKIDTEKGPRVALEKINLTQETQGEERNLPVEYDPWDQSIGSIIVVQEDKSFRFLTEDEKVVRKRFFIRTSDISDKTRRLLTGNNFPALISKLDSTNITPPLDKFTKCRILRSSAEVYELYVENVANCLMNLDSGKSFAKLLEDAGIWEPQSKFVLYAFPMNPLKTKINSKEIFILPGVWDWIKASSLDKMEAAIKNFIAYGESNRVWSEDCGDSHIRKHFFKNLKRIICSLRQFEDKDLEQRLILPKIDKYKQQSSKFEQIKTYLEDIQPLLDDPENCTYAIDR